MSASQRRADRQPRTLLEQLIWQREATYEEQVEQFSKLARQLNEPATLTVRHLQRLASGERSGDRAVPSTRRVLRQLYGHPVDELLRAPQPLAPAPGQRQSELLTGTWAAMDLDHLVNFADNADALEQLTHHALAEPCHLLLLDVVPEVWQAAVVRWLLDPDRCSPAPDQDRSLTPVDVEIVCAATRTLSGWDYQYGGGRSRLLVAQCLASEALPLARRAGSDSPLGREYLSAVSALARLAGWTAYDIGYHGAAQQFLMLALNFAREAGDRALGGRILAGMSHQANYLGQHHRAVELARAAQDGARGQATPTTMALFHAMEARALAVLGEEVACTSALTTAERFLAQGNPDNDPEWIRFFDAAELHAEFAHCFRDLGHAELAVEHAERSIQESDTIYVRSLSFCRTVLATAHLQRHDLEQALEVARGVVDTAARLRSRRIVTYLDDFRARLKPNSADPHVQRFDKYVTDHLPTLEPAPASGRVPST